MTELQQISWIKTNLAAPINAAIEGTMYTEDWLGGIAQRETGSLIALWKSRGTADADIAAQMRGDLSQREHEIKPLYHGFSFFQIDIGSYPDFVNSGAWKDPFAAAKKAVEVLETDRKYILSKIPMLPIDTLARAITASYNCGCGSIVKVLANKADIDSRTTGHNYSAEVFRLRNLYKTI